jgi:anthranilate phosphoribosyltransferase
MIQHLIKKVIDHHTLSEKEASTVMEGLAAGEISDLQASSLLSIMRYRGETPEEIVGFVKVIRKHSHQVPNVASDSIMDTCGTGGDGASTFNISTAVGLILGSLGIKIAKHGNKAITSKSGSSDVLEVLGIRMAENAIDAKSQLEKYDMAFLHAPNFHPALKKIAALRQMLPFRTIFNMAGPLCNPTNPSYQLIGVSDMNSARSMARALTMLGIKKALLVTGHDGLDECSISGRTNMILVKNGIISNFTYTPEQAGLKRSSVQEITVKNKQESAERILDILKGKSNEAAKNIVLLNGAAALFASDHVTSIREGVGIIEKCLLDGTAYNHLMSVTKKGENGIVI